MTEAQIDGMRKVIKNTLDNYHCMSGELIACDSLIRELDKYKKAFQLAYTVVSLTAFQSHPEFILLSETAKKTMTEIEIILRLEK